MVVGLVRAVLDEQVWLTDQRLSQRIDGIDGQLQAGHGRAPPGTLRVATPTSSGLEPSPSPSVTPPRAATAARDVSRQWPSSGSPASKSSAFASAAARLDLCRIELQGV